MLARELKSPEPLTNRFLSDVDLERRQCHYLCPGAVAAVPFAFMLTLQNCSDLSGMLDPM